LRASLGGGQRFASLTRWDRGWEDLDVRASDATEARRRPTVGRDREREALGLVIQQAVSGCGTAVVVAGDPGIGKTTMLNDAARVAECAGVRVLRCSGVQAESNIAFAGLNQLLRPVVDRLVNRADGAADLLRAALGLDPSKAADLYRVALATLELLADVAGESPVLVIADDAQWLDQSTLDVLAFISRRISAEPISVVAAMRTGADSSISGSALPQLPLIPLNDMASRRLLDSVAPDLTSSDRERVLRSADGNPLALVELPCTLDQSGPTPGWTPVGELIVASFTARMSELPAPTRLLLLAAALGDDVPLGRLCTAAGTAGAMTVAVGDVQPAVDAGFVTVEGGRVWFGHRLMASAIYQSSTVGDRVAMHAALSNAFGANDDRRAWHAAAAAVGPDDQVARQLEAVAQRSLRRGSLTAATTALERAADLWGDDARRIDVLLAAGGHAAEAGDERRAAALADRVGRHADLDVVQQARLLLLREGASPLGGGHDTSVAELTTAASALRHVDADAAEALVWAAASRCYWTSAGMADRQLVIDTAERLGFSGDVPRRIGTLAYVVDADRRASLYADLLAAESEADDVAGLRSLAMAAEYLGDHDRAARLFGATVTAARRDGALGAVCRLQALQAWASLWAGDLDTVSAIAGETERLADELNQPMWHGAALLVHELAAGLRGDYVGARQRLHVILDSSVARDVRVFHTMALYGLAIGALGAEHFEDAYTYLRRIVDVDSDASHYRARQWVVADLAEAALATGRREECAALVTGLMDEFRDHPTPAVRFTVGYAEALWADDDSAGQYAAAVSADRGGCEFIGARAKMAYGSWLRRNHRPREARAFIADAHDTLSRLGMASFANRAGRELRAAGGSSVRRTAATELTPQEMQIAQMAAQGLSNRQIGEQLFLSHRTVGSHLYRIFPKLNITARGQLAQAL
jgi:DNA-binding CsgD family transcriptional regulator/tetratricopeptide (TPR) repeat protein